MSCQATAADDAGRAAGPESAEQTISSAANETATSDTSDAAAAMLLYDVLANAASAPILHVAMYRETYANKADADARRDPGSIASSVSELDTTNGNYRSVFANNYLHHPGFTSAAAWTGRRTTMTTTRSTKRSGQPASRTSPII